MRRGQLLTLMSGGVVAAAAAAALAAGSGGGSQDRAAIAEPRLDASSPAQGRRRPMEGSPRSRRPTVVELVTPGGRPREGAGRDEQDELPERVLRENAKIRRELDHIKSLEAERRRVTRALGLAAAGYDGPLRLGAGGLAWPLPGPIVSPFGPRWGRLHAGIDIAAPAGTGIRAAEAGQVVLSGPFGGYGNYVCVQHSARLSSCYAHLSRIVVQKGELLRQGDPIGLVGCTGHCFGDHLHFETRVSGRPVDPLEYL